ncbi:hypothetical protein HYW44_00735 [Candidatus Daviesbacteria bacterium]|nr:hypothetical protein [Candidatus Daviesbacteria bacterium]
MKNNLLNQKGIIHALALLILTIGFGVAIYLSQNPQIFAPKSSNNETESIVKLTNQLIQKKDTGNSRELINIAVKRQELLLGQLKSNPEIFLRYTTLINQRKSFPHDV